MLSRRDLMAKAAVGAAAALAVGAVGTGVAAATRPLRDRTDDAGTPTEGAAGDGDRGQAPGKDTVGLTAPPPWELVAPLAAGSALAYGWRLADMTPVRDGSTVVTLQNERGRVGRVHLCRNDGSPQGLIYTRRVDFVVMNQGYGDLPTEEHLGQAVAALAHAVAANEGTAAEGVLAALLPHAERVQRYAAVTDASVDGKLR